MENNLEVEVKLQLTEPSLYSAIMTAPALVHLAQGVRWRRQELEAVYFDTADHRLQQQELAYRIRREDNACVATLKGKGSSAGGLHQRQEWNVTVAGVEPDLQVFVNTEIGAMLAELSVEALVPQFRTVFERHLLPVQTTDGSLIEVALDRGAIIADGKTAPILELELELKHGQPAALLRLAALLAKDYPLLLEPRSKYYRALQLADRQPQDRQDDLFAADLDWRKDMAGHIHRLLELCQAMQRETNRDVRGSVALLLELWAKTLEN